MIHQYYYHNNECKADKAESKDCICWHDEGTGPFANERHDHKNRRIYDLKLHWRVKPDELAAANERIKRLEGELESTKADRDSWSNQSDEFAKTAADLIIRIKRLEEAGDALFELCDASPIQYELVDQIPQRLKAWEEAKEEKP